VSNSFASALTRSYPRRFTFYVAQSRSLHSFVGLEAVLLVDSNPWQLLPSTRQLVATARQFLLGLEQLQPGCKPLLTCSSLILSHYFLSFQSMGSWSFCVFRWRLRCFHCVHQRDSGFSVKLGAFLDELKIIEDRRSQIAGSSIGIPKTFPEIIFPALWQGG